MTRIPRETDLAGRTVFITGASAGIGVACAELFAGRGSRLILAARRSEKLESVADKLRADHDVEVHTMELDVRDRESVRHAVETLEPKWSEIDVLVNNAGLARGFEPLQEGSADDWDEMIDTNVKGLLYVTRAVLPGMVERNRGHIINLGSISGSETYPNGAVYCSSKAAVATISEGLRMDLLGTDVRVTNIEPGMVETEFSIVRFHGDDNRAAGVYEGVTPLYAEDVADTVLYAASRAPHVNIDSIMLKPVAQAWATMVSRG